VRKHASRKEAKGRFRRDPVNGAAGKTGKKDSTAVGVRFLMAMRRKSDLPQKTCATCGRPFTWRKKWAKVWDEVRYCSDRCRGARGKAAVSTAKPRD
jgi:hypothetical protein